MTWAEDCEQEIDRLIKTQDISEVVAKAVSTIIEGKIDMLCVSMGRFDVGCDPKQTIDFGERLLVACVDEILQKSGRFSENLVNNALRR